MLYICLANMARNNIISKREIRMMMCPTNAHISIGTPYVLQMILGKIYEEEDYKRYTRIGQNITKIGLYISTKCLFTIHYLSSYGRINTTACLSAPNISATAGYPAADSEDDEEDEEDEEDEYEEDNEDGEYEFEDARSARGWVEPIQTREFLNLNSTSIHDRSYPYIDYSKNDILYENLIKPTNTLIDYTNNAISLFSLPDTQSQISNISLEAKNLANNFFTYQNQLRFLKAPFTLFLSIYNMLCEHHGRLQGIISIWESSIEPWTDYQLKSLCGLLIKEAKEVQDQLIRTLVYYNAYRQGDVNKK